MTGDLQRVSMGRVSALEQLEQNEVIRQDAEAKGVKVSDREIDNAIDGAVQQEIAGLKAQYKSRPQDLGRVYAMIASRNGLVQEQQDTMTETKFARLLADHERDTHRDLYEMQLLNDKLMGVVTPPRPMTEAEARASYDEVTLRQIFVALHPTGKPTRTGAQAKQRADELLAKLRGGASFADLARTESDDPVTGAAGGLMEGGTEVNALPLERKQALIDLKVGDLVKAPIKSPYGYDLIKIEKRVSKLPADFEKNKQQQIKNLSLQEQRMAWGAYTRALLAKAKIKVQDDEMKAYLLQRRAGKPDEVLALLENASQSGTKLGPGLASVFYQMATIYSAKNQWAKAADFYERTADSLGSSSDSSALIGVNMGIGRAYENVAREATEKANTAANEQAKAAAMAEANKAKSKAIDAYQVASDNATNDQYIHEQLQRTFTSLGRPDLAAQEAKTVDTMRQAELERNKQNAERERQMELSRPKRPMGPSPVTSK